MSAFAPLSDNYRASVHIGQWVMRRRYGVAHLVESIIAGDAITRCGRRLSDEPTRDGGGLLLAHYGTRQCRQCQPSREQEDPT